MKKREEQKQDRFRYLQNELRELKLILQNSIEQNKKIRYEYGI